MNTLSQKSGSPDTPKLHLAQANSIQPKLHINSPGDKYEQEADAMADKVMRMPASSNDFKPKTGIIGSSIQRKCAACEEEEKQRKIMRKETGGLGGSAVSNAFSSTLNATKGGGTSLPQSTRGFMENAFSTDFSNVRIHNDSQANQLSRDINAKAFTHGNDIYFGAGQYAPNTYSGKSLLAHELTHTIQQGANVYGRIQRDFAVEPLNPNAVFDGFNGEQIDEAIEFNTRQRFSDEDILIIKDVLGNSELTPEINESFINSIGEYQAQNNITVDGKLGGVTATRLSRELRAEGRFLGSVEGRDLIASSRRMALRGVAMNIATVAIQNSPSGSATYRVNFRISDRRANGWIIQHVVFSANTVNCAGVTAPSANAAPPNNYWEGWRVINGVVQCGFTGTCANAHDEFTTINEAANTSGTIRVRGRVTFVPDYQLNTPPWQTGGGHPAADLPHRDTAPENWSDGDAKLHQLTITFNNCIAPQPNLVLNTVQ